VLQALSLNTMPAVHHDKVALLTFHLLQVRLLCTQFMQLF
jgi:hypothetical protein